MDRFYYEIVAAPDGARHVAAIQSMIAGHPTLVEGSGPWVRRTPPSQSDLYALLVVPTDGLCADPELCRKVAHASAGGFPLIPVVENLATYDSRQLGLRELAEQNIESLANPDRLIRSLLHHGGIELLDGGGHVFISYARADGSTLAEAVQSTLKAAGIGRTMDVYAFPGGDVIQDDIEQRIRVADLVVLIDSGGASRSSWVAEELDIALASHVQVIAVSPTARAFHHALQVPHVDWAPGADAAAEVLRVARRILARKLAFRARVARTLKRIARLRQWEVSEHGERWQVRSGRRRALTVAYVAEAPRVEAVTALRDAVHPGRGLLVAGVRPLQRVTAKGLWLAAGKAVSVTPLPTMASKIPRGVAVRPLKHLRVLLSAAMPSDPDEVELARLTLGPFVVMMTQALVEMGATLVFGGHPSVTPLVHQAIKELIEGRQPGRVELHMARAWKTDVVSVKPEVREGPLFQDVHWHGAGRAAADDVAALRDGMIQRGLDAAVFAGGKTAGFIGPRPGIVDEYERFKRACRSKPTFVLGLAGGAARTLPEQETPLGEVLRTTADSDLAVALIVAELLGL